MRHRATAVLVFLASANAFSQQPPITQVHTALNHLTVIELPEPVTIAAAGSDAFDIKRHGNRVFIEPVRAKVSTNLFLWTAHGESVYELEPAGEVNAMNVLIAPKPQPQPANDSRKWSQPIRKSRKIADMVMSKTLFQTQHVSQRETKLLADGVTIQVEEVVHAKGSLYVRYQVVNTGKTPYRVIDPSVAGDPPRASACFPSNSHQYPIERQDDQWTWSCWDNSSIRSSTPKSRTRTSRLAPRRVGIVAIRVASSVRHCTASFSVAMANIRSSPPWCCNGHPGASPRRIVSRVQTP